jgi:hypothetical protein
MHASPKYAECSDAPSRGLTLHTVLAFSTAFVAVALTAAALFDLFF